MIQKFLLLAVFGLAMGHVEGVSVVYLRKALGILGLESNAEAIKKLNIPERYLFIEKTKEVATIVILATLASLVGSGWLDKLVVFVWTFAFWNLFYYLSLYLLIRWPPKLTTTDVLFLIPRPWIAPVWVPIGLSSLAIVIIAVFLLRAA